jgi:hypothetical protein
MLDGTALDAMTRRHVRLVHAGALSRTTLDAMDLTSRRRYFVRRWKLGRWWSELFRRALEAAAAAAALDDLYGAAMREPDEPDALAFDLVDDDARPPPPTLYLADTLNRHAPPTSSLGAAPLEVREAAA